jgi:hypothetical protein
MAWHDARNESDLMSMFGVGSGHSPEARFFFRTPVCVFMEVLNPAMSCIFWDGATDS